jgi:hypothetical protein
VWPGASTPTQPSGCAGREGSGSRPTLYRKPLQPPGTAVPTACRTRHHPRPRPAGASHLAAMSRVETEPCQPVHCLKCGVAIRCGDACRNLASGYVRHLRRWSCGKGDCATGFGRYLVYHCSQACYWRHRRARPRTAVKPRQCAVCGKTFTPRRSDARMCSGTCRQARYRRQRHAAKDRRRAATARTP